jgi:hypothetical protein
LTFAAPTAFTGADARALLPVLRADLARSVNPGNRDFAVRNIDVTKEGRNLQHPDNTTPYGIHFGAGVQRELRWGIVGSADVAWKQFVHTFINGIDYNRVDSASGRVIPECTGQQATDPGAVCSRGRFYFDTTIGRARYVGLLLRAQRRFSGRAQMLASYALGSFVGSNGTGVATSENPGGRVFGFNNDNWFENYGPLPTDSRRILNVSGAVELPKDFMLAMSMSAYSAPPFAPYVSNVDFNGDGTINDLLPGSTVNQFRSSSDKRTLEALVSNYNRSIAGTPTARGLGARAPVLTLPDSYGFNDSFWAHDVRVTRTFRIGRERRIALFIELFNALNIANLTGVVSNLRQPTFGRATARFTQVFGSGGPRAAQVGAKVSF